MPESDCEVYLRMSACLQEDCANWNGGRGCVCRLLELEPVDVHACEHDWLDRPESDTQECLICGGERHGW